LKYQLIIKVDITGQPDDIAARKMALAIIDELDEYPGLKYHLSCGVAFSAKLQEIEKDKVPRGVPIKIVWNKPSPYPIKPKSETIVHVGPRRQCRFCDCDPCMCGKNDYGTAEENRLKDQLDEIKSSKISGPYPKGEG
jgi:hypothetical protein